ncbi:methyl-accepting chemotaxis protein [Allorhizobium sp. NPDC080224]|uniref:methyl-accepting chemotaxis protein n=1 Tax=Allorhizobium sp. NPDC080224 TaxID=3390547 RepID=UPI003CFC5886
MLPRRRPRYFDALEALLPKPRHQARSGNQIAADAYAEANSAYSTTLTITFSAIGAIAVLIAGSIWFAVSGIARPIQTITGSMNKLAAGDADTAVPFAGRADEIGEMAAAVEIFRKNALDNRRLEAETAAQRSQSEEQRRLTAEQERVRAQAMAQATTGLADGLKQLASGNLTFQLEQSFAEEFESLRADFNSAIGQLKETLTSVSQSTSSIDGGSREVSQSAEDLSKRTEQQAASLEETAAALDQITTNVANSSKRAEEARTIAAQANISARQSGSVVANAVDAMERIEQSSSQISNIIGVIDEIAFQTNLLALNAGVEAARAGEAGKGFAVVAQEVRELAQRSAQAAKEIKELIRNSTVEVEKGVKLVSDTGEALKSIEKYVITINEHMDAIATSAREQSVGLSEVNTAVNQMDQVTQQNAAMVEEANAAGATLAKEAGRLRALVSQFQLGQSNGQYTTQSPAPAVTAASAHRPFTSPARRMVGTLSKAFGSAAPKAESWEDF